MWLRIKASFRSIFRTYGEVRRGTEAPPSVARLVRDASAAAEWGRGPYGTPRSPRRSSLTRARSLCIGRRTRHRRSLDGGSRLRTVHRGGRTRNVAKDVVCKIYIRKTHDFLFGAFASYFTYTKQIKCNFWKALPTCNKKSPLLFLYFFELLRQFSGETLFKSLLIKYLHII